MSTPGGSATNTGSQQVSVYPYQQLSSVYANTILYNTLQPGIENVSVTLSTGSAGNFNVTIGAGASFTFWRQATDPTTPTQTDNVLGKITLNSPVSVSVTGTGGVWSGSPVKQAVYIMADWTFNPQTPTLKYLNFYVRTDSDITGDKLLDGTFQHTLCVCTLLNNQAVALIGNNTSSLNSYHIAYDYTPVKDLVKNTAKISQALNVFFEPSGLGVYVGSGTVQIGGSEYLFKTDFGLMTYSISVSSPSVGTLYVNGTSTGISISGATTASGLSSAIAGLGTFSGYTFSSGTNPTFNVSVINPGTQAPVFTVSGQSGSNLTNPFGGLTFTQTVSPTAYPIRGIPTGSTPVYYGLLAPATPVRYYVSNYVNNTAIDVISAGTVANYYQVDFLRLRRNDLTHGVELVWESFLSPIPNTTGSGNNLTLTFSGLGVSTKDQFKAYLSQYSYPVQGNAITLAVAVRPRGVIATTNLVWPEGVIYTKDGVDFIADGVANPLRSKVPVFNSTDLGYN